MRLAILVALVAGCGDNTSTPANGLQANPPRLASIALTSYSYSQLKMTGGSAEFSTYAGTVAGPCTVQSAGACQLTTCPRASDGSRLPGPMRTPVSAGALTLDALGQTTPFTTTTPDGVYSVSLPPDQAWTGGEGLTVTATGADVPAFTAKVTAPGRPRMLMPPRPPDNAGPTAIDRTAGLTITWKPDGSGTLTIMLSSDFNSSFVNLSCDAQVGAGSYALTPAVLAAYPMGGVNTTLTATVHNRTTTPAGAWSVQFDANAPPDDDASDLPWIGGATLQ